MRLAFIAPVTVAGPQDLNHNVFGFRNGGNSFIDLNNGMWTLNPGETLMVGSQTDDNMVRIDQILVSFRTNPAETAPQEDKLQILAINERNQVC